MLLLLPLSLFTTGNGISQLFVSVAATCEGDGSGTEGIRNDGGQDRDGSGQIELTFPILKEATQQFVSLCVGTCVKWVGVLTYALQTEREEEEKGKIEG